MESDRSLWTAVLLQAREDLLEAGFETIEYNEAIAFFLHGGSWIQSRENIADHTGISAQAIQLAGERMVRARCAERGEPLPQVLQPRARKPVVRRVAGLTRTRPAPAISVICEAKTLENKISVMDAPHGRFTPFGAFYDRLGLRQATNRG